MSGDGASCEVGSRRRAPPVLLHVALRRGHVGTITVGSAAPGTATATTSAGAAPLITGPRAVETAAPGRPTIYWAGYGLLALGALLGLVTVLAYVWFSPRFQRPWR